MAWQCIHQSLVTGPVTRQAAVENLRTCVIFVPSTTDAQHTHFAFPQPAFADAAVSRSEPELLRWWRSAQVCSCIVMYLRL